MEGRSVGNSTLWSLVSVCLVAKTSLFQTFEDSYAWWYSGQLQKTELVTLFLEQRTDNLNASSKSSLSWGFLLEHHSTGGAGSNWSSLRIPWQLRFRKLVWIPLVQLLLSKRLILPRTMSSAVIHDVAVRLQGRKTSGSPQFSTAIPHDKSLVWPANAIALITSAIVSWSFQVQNHALYNSTTKTHIVISKLIIVAVLEKINIMPHTNIRI